jgi:predicted PurR-regulated permease PerM
MSTSFRYIIVFLGLVLIGLTLWYFKPIVSYILIAGIFSLIGRPLVDLLRKARVKGFRIPRWTAAAITLIALWILIFSFFRVFIPLLAQEANELSKIDIEKIESSLDKPLDEVNNFFYKYNMGTNSDQNLEDYLAEQIASVLNFTTVSNFFGSLAGFLGNFFIAFFSISFITFFFLKEEYMLSNAILLMVPSKQEEGVKHILSSIKYLLSRYFIGILIQITCIIILVTVGQSIVGLDFSRAMVIGLFAGFLNVIPYIGPILGTSVGLIIGLATHLHLEFYAELLPLLLSMLTVFLIVQAIDNFVFQPVIFSNSVKAHPLEIFLVILAAGYLAGVIGMILAIPAYTVIRVIAKEFFNNLKIVKKITEKI